MTLDELHSRLLKLGCKPQHERRIYRAMLNRATWPELNDERYPLRLRQAVPQLKAEFEALLRLIERQDTEDSSKLLFALTDQQSIETVLLPRDGVCVSCQVGCAVGCLFCMTGRCGLVRQLDALEIIAQVAWARRINPKTKKVAFMGMGEPSHNLRAVMSAIHFLGEYGDFGHKNLVLSTVGDPRVFAALQDSPVKPALAISLHSAFDEKRRRLLPKAGKIDVQTLVDAAEIYARSSGYPIQYEWTLIENLNDGQDEMQRLIELLSGKYAMMNFIPVNAVPDSPYRRPAIEHCAALARQLHQQHIVTKLRHSAAQEVQGGCGQLRARVINAENR